MRQHRGRLVDFTGDNFLAEFPTAFDAVECAVGIQRVLASRNADVAAERRMKFRIGIHMGDIRVEGERIFGDGVNVAARLESLAAAGGICISATVHEQVRNKLQVGYDDLGDQTVKNIADQVHVYQVRLQGSKAADTAQPTSRPRLLSGGVALAGAALLIAAGLWLLSPSSPPDSGEIRSIAVLPLENLSGDSEQEYFADGMTDALIAGLGRIAALRVISRTSVMQYKGARKPLPEIASELGVQAVLEGTVVREGDRVRITVQLIDARSDIHLWTADYERELTGILALQSEVARAVSKQIEIELTPQEQLGLAKSREIRPQAYEAYLQGRHFWNKRTAADYERSIAHFQRAIELDPESALGYAGLAQAYDQQGVYGIIAPREAQRLIRDAVTRALAIDDSLGEAHVSLGDLHFWMWNWEGVEREYGRALELNPNDAIAHDWLGYYLMAKGRTAEGLSSVGRALELDPLSPGIKVDAGRLHLFARDYETATKYASDALRIDPSSADAHAFQAMILSTQGRHREAVEAGRRGARLSAGADLETAWLGYSLARAGETDEAAELLAELVRRSQQRYVDPIHIARIQAGLGNRDELFRWLEKAYEAGSLWLTWVGVSPVFDGVRDDPQLADLLRRIGLEERQVGTRTQPPETPAS